MLVEGRNIFFLKRLAESIKVAFAFSSLPSIQNITIVHQRPQQKQTTSPPSPSPSPTSNHFKEVNNNNNCSAVSYQESPRSSYTNPKSFSIARLLKQRKNINQPPPNWCRSICNIFTLTLLIFSYYYFFIIPSLIASIQTHLLIIFIIFTYLYFCFDLRTLLSFHFVFDSNCFELFSRIVSCLFVSKKISNHCTFDPSQHLTKSHHPSYNNNNNNKRSATIQIRLILIAMVSLAISSLANYHHANKLFVGATSSSSSSTSSLTIDSKRHSNESPPSSRAPKLFTNEQLRRTVEMQFLRIMGLDSVPRPEKHHKVPDYIIDLYRWFRQSDNSLIDNGDGDGDGDDDYDDKDRLQSKSSNQIINPLIGLTTDDLFEINSIANQIETNYDNEIGHHRVSRKRRSTQTSRVTLQGPSSTIISHKAFHKPDSSYEQLKIDRQTKAKSRPFSNGVDSISSNKAHLKFDVHLPSDEKLTGAELRLYRHSWYEHESHINNNDYASLDASSHQQFLSKHNNFWPLYHWSVRQHLNSSIHSPYHDKTEFAFENSHLSKVDNFSSSGEEYSQSTPNYKDNNYFMQRVNIYHLLRPLSEQTNRLSDKIFKISKLIDTQVIDIRNSGWLSFDVFPAVDWWIKHPTENYGLLVTLMDHQGRNESSCSHLFVLNPDHSLVQSNSQSFDSDHPWHEVQPLIITFSNDVHAHQNLLIHREKILNRSKRDRKRGLLGQRPKNNNNKKKNHKTSSRRREYCRRHQMYFDFKDVGWMDWIVAPPGFQAFYCKGECSFPMSQQINKTNHAIIQSLINSVNPAVVPEPCCIPTDLSAITLLYVDQNDKVVLKNYPNMVVEGCGCK